MGIKILLSIKALWLTSTVSSVPDDHNSALLGGGIAKAMSRAEVAGLQKRYFALDSSLLLLCHFYCKDDNDAQGLG